MELKLEAHCGDAGLRGVAGELRIQGMARCQDGVDPE